MKKILPLIALSVVCLIFSGCARGGSSSSVVLQSSRLLQRANSFKILTLAPSFFTLPKDTTGVVTLDGVTGLANTLIFFLEDQNDCGYVPWTAGEFSGPAAENDNVFSSFDLKDPPTWTGRSNYNPNCQDGTVETFGLFAAYWDLEITIDNTAYTIRIAFGDYENYRKGDVLIKQGTDFCWLDTARGTLECAVRPASAKQITSLASASYYVDQEGNQMDLLNIRVTITDDEGIPSPLDFRFISYSSIDINFDLTNPDIKVTDTSSAADILNTFDPGFVHFSSNALKARVHLVAAGTDITSDDGITDVSNFSFTFSCVGLGLNNVSVTPTSSPSLENLKMEIASAMGQSVNLGQMVISYEGTELTGINFAEQMSEIVGGEVPHFTVTFE